LLLKQLPEVFFRGPSDLEVFYGVTS